MIVCFLKSTLVVLLLLKNGCSTPVLEHDKALKYEEYVVEHEISFLDAKHSVFNTSLQQSKYDIQFVDITFTTDGEGSIGIVEINDFVVTCYLDNVTKTYVTGCLQPASLSICLSVCLWPFFYPLTLSNHCTDLDGI
nr:unnamed protein product [Callosobruchus analis]